MRRKRKEGRSEGRGGGGEGAEGREWESGRQGGVVGVKEEGIGGEEEGK